MIGSDPATASASPGAPEGESNAYAFPLTFAQQRLWFLTQLEGDPASYNIPWAVRIEGALNVSVLEHALREIVDRHEVLRTTFSMSGNEPAQIVGADSSSFALLVADLSSFPADSREQEAHRLAQEEARRPMDLVHGPLFRITLLRLNHTDHILLFTLHHIIFDGWSRRVFVRELAAIYEAFLQGKPSPLPVLPLQYADYAVWQRENLRGATLDRHLTYWRKQLEAVPSHLELPTDRPRPATQSFAGALCKWQIPASLVTQLTALSRAAGTTLFMTLLGAFDVLLAKYSGQEDIVIGTPIANRNRAEIEALIGFFTNTLVLRTDVSGDPSFLEVLTRVKETALGAYAHQDMPFEKLVEELKPERSLSFNPLFQVFFSLQNAPKQSLQLPGLRLTTLERIGSTSKFDLSLFLNETPEGLRGDMEYSTDLFEAATIEQMLRHYEGLLRAVVENPQQRLSQIDILGEFDKHTLLVEYNDTTKDFPLHLTVPHLFAAQAARTPQAVALHCGAQQLTYSELDARSNQLARHLQALGAGPEINIALCLDRSTDLVVSLLAILKSGAAYLPLDPAYPKDRIAFILDDAQSPIVLTHSALLSSLPTSAGKKLVCIDTDARRIAGLSSQSLAACPSPHDSAYLLYTSGSTGQPKGVQIEHGALSNFLFSMQREPGLDSQDTLVAVTTLSFDIAGLEIYLPLITGARVVLATRQQATDPLQLAALLESSHATVMQATPATWRMLIDSGWAGRSSLRILCGGEALPADLARQLRSRCASLWNMYGPTETTVWSSVYPVTSDLEGVTPIGHPIANTQFYILDAHRQLTPPGVPGELYIGGKGLARGYFRRPELTAEKFVANPFSPSDSPRLYRTGDLARWRSDGQLLYLGRIDNQVKLRGFRIELGEIETLLQQQPGVQQCLVMAREDQLGQRLVAYWTAAETSNPPSTETLRSHLRQGLPEFMIPSAFVLLDAFPLTPNGKINRKALPAPENNLAESSEHLAPRTDLEFLLFKIWVKVLGTEAIGIRDNFFDAGGHSLLAVRMMREIHKATGKDLPLALLFQGATIEKLAAALQEGEEIPPCPTLMEIQGAGTAPPFFAVATPGVNALGYLALARRLGKNQPLYKLQKYARARTTEPYSSDDFHQLALEYLQVMREVQPKGPYYLGGMCEGARIAYDMARLLEAQGETVALLAVIDTWVVEHTQIRPLGNLHYYGLRWRRFRVKSFAEQKREFLAVLRKKLRRGTTRGSALTAAPKHSWNDHYWPKDFVAPSYRGDIVVFKRPRQPYYYVNDPLLGWAKRTSGAVRAIHIQSPHFLVLREPYVEELGRLLSELLPKQPGEPAMHSSDEHAATSATVAVICSK